MKTIINKITRLLLVVLMLLVSFGINNTVYADDPLTPIIPTLERGGTYLIDKKFAVSSDGAYYDYGYNFLSEGEYTLRFLGTDRLDGKPFAFFAFYDSNNKSAGTLTLEYEPNGKTIIGVKCYYGAGTKEDQFFFEVAYGDLPIADEVTVKVDVGSNHTALVSKLVKGLKEEGISASASGSVITMSVRQTKAILFLMSSSERFYHLLGDSRKHNNEMYMGFIAPAKTYDSEDDLYDSFDLLDEEDTMLSNNQKFYFLWSKPIKSITAISSYPEVDQYVSFEEDLDDYGIQTPAPEITLTGNCFIPLSGDGVPYTQWYDTDWNRVENAPFVEGTNYNAEIYLVPNFGYYFDQNIKVTVNKDNKDSGYDVGEDYLNMYITLPAQKVTYSFVGKNKDYVKGSGSYKLAAIKRTPNDTAYENFVETDAGIIGKVYVDDKPLEYKKDYEVKKGSLALTFTKEFMNSLELGEHDDTVVFADDSINGSFKVVKASPQSENKYNIPKTGVE